MIDAGPDKVHFRVQFTRVRADGSAIGSYRSLYIVTYLGGVGPSRAVRAGPGDAASASVMDADAKKTTLRMISYGLYVLTADDGKGTVGAATVKPVSQTAAELTVLLPTRPAQVGQLRFDLRATKTWVAGPGSAMISMQSCPPNEVPT